MSGGWTANLFSQIDDLVLSYTPYLTTQNGVQLWKLVLSILLKRVESVLRKSKLSDFGVIKLDGDVRFITGWVKERLGEDVMPAGFDGVERLRQINKIVGIYDIRDLKEIVDSCKESNPNGAFILKKSEVKTWLNLKVWTEDVDVEGAVEAVDF